MPCAVICPDDFAEDLVGVLVESERRGSLPALSW
jgi:hypothetical protein